MGTEDARTSNDARPSNEAHVSGRSEPVDLTHFCCQEVLIPPQLPNILKQYAKAAIRTQPRDLLLWSAAYFRAMANGDVPPVKDRLEYPSGTSPSGLTPGLLRILHKQLRHKRRLTTPEIKMRWVSLCLPAPEVDRILATGQVDTSGFIDWVTFLSLAARTMGRDIPHTLEMICEVLTDQPDGCAPYINFTVFAGIYEYLAQMENPRVPKKQVEHALAYLKTTSEANFDLIGPPDWDLSKCPPLQ